MTCLGLERRSVFPSEVQAEATALACSLSKEEGETLSRWGLTEIAAKLVALGLVSISAWDGATGLRDDIVAEMT